MFKNYLKIAFRNLTKHKIYSAINILGLTAGLACFILVGLYVSYESSFDKYHENIDDLYRLVATGGRDDNYEGIAKVTAPWGEAAFDEIPEVRNMTRFIFHGTTLMRYEDKRFFESSGFFADSTVLEMFSFPLIQGDVQTALTKPNSIVIDPDFAERFFGNENPIGKVITVSEETEYTVTGVLEKIPSNSHFTFQFLVSFNTYSHPDMDDWIAWNQFYTYLHLQDGADPGAVEAKMQSILDTNLPEEFTLNSSPTLQPVASIHLTSNLWRELTQNSDISSLYIYGIVGFFILLLACINFVNLMTARATTRLKEVGIRKTIGAGRNALIRQFLGESVIVVLISLIFSIAVVDLLLPAFTDLASTTFERALLFNPINILIILATAAIIGILAGIYPAFVLSAPKPSSILKGVKKVQGNASLRKGLVVFQFTASVALICSTLVMQQQFGYMQSKNLGFDKDQILSIPIRNFDMNSQYETVKDRFSRIPGVRHVSFSGNMPGGSDWGLPYSAEGIPEEDEPSMRVLAVDHDFLETYDMNVIEGRDFSQEYSTDALGAFLLNQEAARQLGWQDDAIGKLMSVDIDPNTLDMQYKPVIGVVEDFHFRSMRETISPLYFFIPPPNWFSRISVKIEAERTQEVLDELQVAWAEFDPVHPLTASFFDEQYGLLHQVEENAAKLVSYLTYVAILIACFGLFGLVAFSAQQRTKEIGIRKVLGSSVPEIVGLLSREYLVLVGLGFLIGAPFSYYWVSSWLSEFAYRVNVDLRTFFAGFAITIFIAMLAVCYQAIKAALANPVDSLKTE